MKAGRFESGFVPALSNLQRFEIIGSGALSMLVMLVPPKELMFDPRAIRNLQIVPSVAYHSKARRCVPETAK